MSILASRVQGWIETAGGKSQLERRIKAPRGWIWGAWEDQVSRDRLEPTAGAGRQRIC